MATTTTTTTTTTTNTIIWPILISTNYLSELRGKWVIQVHSENGHYPGTCKYASDDKLCEVTSPLDYCLKLMKDASTGQTLAVFYMIVEEIRVLITRHWNSVINFETGSGYLAPATDH